jgi:PAS domain S-box-containing protein
MVSPWRGSAIFDEEIAIPEPEWSLAGPMANGGEYVTPIGALDWSRTALGPVESWPLSLKNIVDLVSASPVAMVVLWGPDLIQIYNAGYAVIAGSGHPQALGQPTRASWREVWGFNATIHEAVLRGEARCFAGRLLTIERNGAPEDAWFDLAYSPLRNDAGENAGTLLIALETTRQVLAERKAEGEIERQRERDLDRDQSVAERAEHENMLRAQEAQLRSILEAAPTAIVVVDEQGAVMEFNPAAEQLWGHAACDVLGRPVLLLAGPEEHRRLREMVERRPIPGDYGAGRPPETAFALTSDGRRLAIEVSVGRARTPSGNLATMFCRDISDRMAGEQRLSELSIELAHVSRLHVMSELAADLAHELNQPLSAATNFLATARMLIERGESGERVVELLGMGEAQLLRSGAIIRRLRDFLTKRDIELRRESIASIVSDSVDLVLIGAPQSTTRIVDRLDPAADMIFADCIQVQQVLVNLLRNSLEALLHAPAEAREIIIASRVVDGDMIEISVSDNGPGLPAEFREQLYSRFATTKQGTAMGIGLSISRRIVEAHGGTLVAENRPEGGAVFRFTMPALHGLVE